MAWHLKNDFQILILCGEKEEDEAEASFLLKKYPGLLFKKIKALRRSFNPFFDIFAFLHIFIVILKFKAHIVHTHGAKSGFTGRLAALAANVPIIIHTYHGHAFHSYFSEKISRLIVFAEMLAGKITTSAVALSETLKKELVTKFKILPASKVAVIRLGFDFTNDKDLVACRQNFRVKYNLQKEDIAIGIVSRIVPVKNHLFFVKVIAHISANNTAHSPAFFIIGDGNMRLQVEKELHLSNISFNDKAITSDNRIVFTSWLTNMPEVMSGLDIVALTSLNEGTPLSVIEAQFYRKPVVSTNAGGVKDCMKDGVTGFVTEQGVLMNFCEKLNLLIANKELRKTMGDAGNKFVSDTFTKEKEVAVIKDFYFSLLKQKGYSFK